MIDLTKQQREAIEWAAWRLKPVIGDEAQAHRDELLSILATHPTETDGPWCQSCGDGLTAHDPGICGNCFAMKYRGDAEDAARFYWASANVQNADTLATFIAQHEGLNRDGLLIDIDAARNATEPRTSDALDAARYRAFLNAGLPITYLGVDYHDKASLDAAIDATRKGASDADQA